ncbi:hypothetical protein U3516DRAFT_638612 [Neocallimastix sp. 'constans']
MDSQDSLKSLSSSSLKNQFSSDYIRLKLNSDEIDTIRMKANESNIFDDNGDEEFSSENEVESQIKKKGTIKEKSTPESRRASIQISIDKFKPRRRSSTILNLQKIQEGTSSYGLLLAPPLFPQSQSLGDHEQNDNNIHNNNVDDNNNNNNTIENNNNNNNNTDENNNNNNNNTDENNNNNNKDEDHSKEMEENTPTKDKEMTEDTYSISEITNENMDDDPTIFKNPVENLPKYTSKKSDLNFKNILGNSRKLKYGNLRLAQDQKLCKCCIGLLRKIPKKIPDPSSDTAPKCHCIGHDHGEFSLEKVIHRANEKIDKKFNQFNPNITKEQFSEWFNDFLESDAYGNSDYTIYKDGTICKSNESSTESIYKRFFNNIFKIENSSSTSSPLSSTHTLDSINNLEGNLNDLKEKEVHFDDEKKTEKVAIKSEVDEVLDEYEEFLNEEENEIKKNIKRNYDNMKRKSTVTGDLGKGLLRLNRNPNLEKYSRIGSKTKNNNKDRGQDTDHSSIGKLKRSKSYKSTNTIKSSSKSKSKINLKSESNSISTSNSISKSTLEIESSTPKKVREVIDQKKFIDPKILDKIHKNKYLNKRLLNNENIFNILTNPIIKITKKKYYNNKCYYKNGILKKRNIGKILYHEYVITSSPFQNYFNEDSHSPLNNSGSFSRRSSRKNLYIDSPKSDHLLHHPYTSKREFSSYKNSMYTKKLTYIKHNYPNCKIKLKPNDVVRIGKPMKALIKWRDHSFSHIPTISKRVHALDASSYLYELNDSHLTKEEKEANECCSQKYDSKGYQRNLYKLQKEILNDYIKESTAIISQKFPNIGEWENSSNVYYNESFGKKSTLFFEEEDSDLSIDEDKRDLNMKNIYPKNMSLEAYLRLYEEMLENKLKKPKSSSYHHHVNLEKKNIYIYINI